MTPPITIVKRTARVGVLGHLDELERLMKLYCNEMDSGLQDVLAHRLTLSSFIAWLRQRQRQSVAGTTVADNDGPAEPQRRGRPSRVADIGD